MKMHTFQEMVKRIAPIPSKRVCVAYGNWSHREGMRGHTTGPVQEFKKELSKYVTVVDMDEFRTSKLCSECFGELKEHAYPDENRISKSTRNVLRCPIKECKAGYWDRDVNAARNILTLLRYLLSGMTTRLSFDRKVLA